MRLFDWLLGAAPADTDPAPAIVNAAPSLPGEDDAETSAPEMFVDADGTVPIDDVFVAIEYRDSRGVLSRRRITMIKLTPGTEAPHLSAICHERRAFRQFRLDRIQRFIDLNGEVIDPRDFWNSIGINVAAISGGGDHSTGQKLRDQFRPALSVLVTLSKCDGFMHPDEIVSILTYVSDEALEIREPCNDAALAELEMLLPKMRPRLSSVKANYLEIQEFNERRKNRFARAVREVILADDRIAVEESDLAEKLERWAWELSDSGDLSVNALLESRLERAKHSQR
jgi:hypothetical protein